MCKYIHTHIFIYTTHKKAALKKFCNHLDTYLLCIHREGEVEVIWIAVKLIMESRGQFCIVARIRQIF